MFKFLRRLFKLDLPEENLPTPVKPKVQNTKKKSLETTIKKPASNNRKTQK